MDYPRHLISHTVTTGDLTTPLEAGLKPGWIVDPESGRVWKYVLEYQTKYGKVPSPEALAAEYPTYSLLADPEPIDYVIDRLRDTRRLAVLETALDRAVAAFERGDADEIQARLSAALADLAAETPAGRDVDITTTGTQRMQRYRDIARRDGSLIGIPTGFLQLDEATGGFRPQQLIVLIGPPKAGKSTALLWMAMAAHAAFKTPLLIGFEMSNEEVEERLDALRAQVSASKLRDGSLTAPDMRKVDQATRRMETSVPFWLSSDITATSTMSGVVAKINSLRPDIAMIDGVYMMQDDHGEKPGSPQALTNVSRSSKRAAQAGDLPIVITTQVLLSKMVGGEVTMQSIGYSSAFGQDADLVIAIEPTREHGIFKVKLLAGRNVKPFAFYVKVDWQTGTIAELTYDPFGDTDDYTDGEFDDDRF